MMNHFRNDSNVKRMFPDYVFKDIIWYEIPIDEEIPTNIGKYDLSLISQFYYFDFYDLDNNYLGQRAYLMECREHPIYTKLNTFTKRMINHYNYVLSLLNKQNKYILPSKFSVEPDFIDMLIHPPYDIDISGIKIEFIDDIEYIIIGNYTKNKIEGYDLIEKNSYEYFIKLTDIVDYIKNNN